MAYGRRKKGGSALMALAKAGGKRRRAAKKAKEEAAKKPAKKPVSKAARTRTEMNTPKGTTLRPIRAVKSPLRKMKGGTNLSARAGQVDPTKRTPKQPTRTPKQRASDKKKLLGKQETLRKASAGMRYGSEYKGAPKLGKKDQERMEESMKLGAGFGVGAAAGGGAFALKLYQMYKAKKAADLAKVPARRSGLGGGKPPAPKPKPKPRKKRSKAQIKKDSMRGASQWR